MEEKPAVTQSIPGSRPRISETASLPPPRRRVRPGLIIIAAIALVVIVAALGYYVRFMAPYETTDEACVESYVTFVSPRVPGPVLKWLVSDNQHVKAGDVLLEIDPRDYQILVDQAKADQQKSAVLAAQATARVGAAAADLYPKFSLTGVVGLQSTSASDWFTAGSRFWSAGPTASAPFPRI
jgi:membrane fusion protein, multidrug efflux system